jgi:hypothetical protein
MCAQISFGAIVSESRGSISDITFSRNRGGAYIKARSGPTLSQSAFAINYRNLMGYASTTWTDVAESEKLQFDVLAESLKRRSSSFLRSTINGRSLFISRVMNLEVPSLPEYYKPVIAPHIEPAVISNSPIPGNPLRFSYSVPAENETYTWKFFCSLPVSLGVRSFNSAPRYSVASEFEYDGLVLNILPSYLFRFGLGALPAGMRIFVVAKRLAYQSEYPSPINFSLIGDYTSEEYKFILDT